MYTKTTLPNGLRIVTHDMKERDSIALGLWIGVGGRHEQDRIKGAAHFLEHIVFKGSRKYPCEEIKTSIEGVGGALNAFTSEEQTCFYAKIPSRHLARTFDVLADMVVYPNMAEPDIAKEKTVVVEEIKMYRDLPQFTAMELLDGLLWPDHPLGKNLAGTPESVTAFSQNDIKQFHREYYVPANIVVAACGRLNHDRITRLAKTRFGKMPSAGFPGYRKADNSQSAPRVRLLSKKIEQMHVALGTIGYDEEHKDRHALNLLSVILGGNMSSRLFVEIREKRGLAYSISSVSRTMQDTGVFLVRAGVDNQRVEETIQLILAELEKVKRAGVTTGEFTRARDYVLGQMLLGLEDTMEHMLWIGETMISQDKTRTLKSLIRDYEKITRADVQRVANDVLRAGRYNLSVVGPLTGDQEKQIPLLLGVRN
ncbi:MAG: insulinase family protein [Candidatus Omnitrophica bacterium]|nr:insulinase family protein [Candidatus Omnitrophota bacterium]